MTSSYLKAMQLTKQLEEKAKEEKKNRQLAEDEMQTVEEIINSAKASDIDSPNAQKFFTEASTAFSEKNYKDALSLVTQANEQIKKDYSEGINSIISSVNTLAEIGKETGADCSKGLALLEEAKSSLTEENFEKATQLAKHSWETFEKIAQEHFSEAFSNAQSMIVLARNSGDDVSNSEDLLEEARKAIDAQEYSAAFTRLKDCLESVGSGLSTQVDELVDEAKGYQITAKELGADVSRIEELVQRTDGELVNNNMEAALSSARLAKSEAEKTINRAIGDFIDAQNASMQEAESIDADTEKAVDFLDRGHAALKNGNYTEAIAAAKDCESEIQNAQFQKVLATISESRSKFMTANKVGADLSEAMEFLGEARDALKEGKFREALEMAKKGDDVVDEIVKDFQDVENTIAELEEQLKVGKERSVDMSSAEKSLTSARDALEDKDFESVKSYVDMVRGEINNAHHSFVTDIIETAELVITAGDRLGANLDEPEDLMKSAITATKEKDYMQAIKYAEKCTNRAEEIIKIHVSNTIASAELALYDAENVDLNEVQPLIDTAKNDFENYAFDSAFEYADKALNLLETAQSSKAREQVRRMEQAIQVAKKMDCDVKSLESTSKKCAEYLNNRDFASVLDEADKAYDEAINLQYVAAERMFGESKLTAIEAKKLGIDITDMKEALKRAKLAFSEENFEKTYKESESASMAAERQISLHQEAYNTITQAAAMVAEAKKNKAEVKQVMGLLSSAKSMFEHFDYENAKKEAEKAIEETEKVVMLYTSADKLSIVKGHMKLLESLEVAELGDLQKNVQEAKDCLKTKNYENALSLSETCEKKALELLKSSIANLISSTESALMDATDVGIDISSQAQELEQAKKYMQESKFDDAIKSANSSMEEVERIKDLSQKAAVEIKIAQGSLNEGETLHANMAKTKELLNNALTELKSSNYDKAIKLASNSSAEARRAIEKFVSDTIKTVKLAIEKAKMDGTTIVVAEKLMDKAMKAFENKDYKGALGEAMKSEGELEKVGLQQEMAEKAIITAETKLENAKEIGMHSSKSVSLLTEARNEVKAGQYVKALEHAIQSGDEIHNVSEEFNEALDTLKLLENQIAVATKIEAEVSIAKKMLTDAQGSKNDHDYKTATEIAKEGIIEARRLSHSKLSTKLSDAYKLTDLAAKCNADVSGAGPLLAEAKTFMGSGKFEVSDEKINYCLDDIKGKLNAHIQDVITQSERAMTHAKELGADITESERLLTQSKLSLDTRKFKDALAFAEKSKGAIDLEKGFEREFIELTYEADKLISNSKKFGVNVKEADEEFKRARELKKTDYQIALETLRKSINMVHAAVKDFRPKLKATISLDKVEKDVWTAAEITVTNEGKALAKDVSVNLMGDVNVEGQAKLNTVRGGGGQEKIQIKVKFENTGEMPLVLKLKSIRIMDGKTFEGESVTTVFVSELKAAAPEKAAFEKLMAVEDTKCNICMGSIKKGLEMIRCTCGREYHATCGERVGECPGCGVAFGEAEMKSDIEDLETKPKEPAKPEPAEETVKEEIEKTDIVVEPKKNNKKKKKKRFWV